MLILVIEYVILVIKLVKLVVGIKKISALHVNLIYTTKVVTVYKIVDQDIVFF